MDMHASFAVDGLGFYMLLHERQSNITFDIAEGFISVRGDSLAVTVKV